MLRRKLTAQNQHQLLMSSNPSPAHQRFSGDYDAFYDPDFTAEISNKMRVPHHISVINRDDYENDIDALLGRDKINEQTLAMHVPDRILVRGGNQHIVGRDELPEMRLEKSMEPQPEPILLSTPPRTLTLDMHAYPAVDAEDEAGDSAKSTLRVRRKTTLSKLHNGDISLFNSSGLVPTTPPGPLCVEDEVSMLKKQIRSVSRRLIIVEQENQQRHQREIVLYSVGVIYFLLKGLMWLGRHW